MVTTADALAAAEAELLRLRNAVEQWLADANASSADIAQLQADLAALQQQVQQLAGSSGNVAAHTHQISEVAGLANALAAKLDDAAGIIQQHHIADGAITVAKIASATTLPPAFISGWFAPAALNAPHTTQHGLGRVPYDVAIEIRTAVAFDIHPAGRIFQAGYDNSSASNNAIYYDDTLVGLSLWKDNFVSVPTTGGGYRWFTRTATDWDWRYVVW